jgi:hypothetical protein
MASSNPRFASLLNFASQKQDALAMIGVACFLFLVSSASAQSKTTHYRSYSSAHYRSAGHVHKFDQKPHSVPSSIAPEVLGKSSGKAAMSPNKELDKLERGSVRKAMSLNSAPTAASTQSTLTPEKHSAPIHFTHKELPQSRHSGAAKIR